MKIFIDDQTGSIYRHVNGSDQIAFTPMSVSGINDLNEGGIVDVWDSIEEEARIRKALAN